MDFSGTTPSNLVIGWFGGLEFPVGLFMLIGIDYSGETLVTILLFCLLWTVRRDNRSFHQLERGIQISVLTGLAFLTLTPFDSSLFYFVVPQPESRTVAEMLYVGRNISVALALLKPSGIDRYRVRDTEDRVSNDRRGNGSTSARVTQTRIVASRDSFGWTNLDVL